VAMAGWKGCIAYLAEEVQGQVIPLGNDTKIFANGRRQSDIVLMTEVEPNDFSMTRLEQRQYLKRIDDFIIDLSLAITHMRDDASTLIRCVDVWDVEEATSYTQKQHSTRQAEPCILRKGLERQRDDFKRFGEQLTALQQKVQSVSTLVSKHSVRKTYDIANGPRSRIFLT
jgi:hypothetical protein